MSKRHDFASRDELDSALASHVAARLLQDIEAGGSASLAVSGGSTPKGMFAALSKADIPWESVWVTLVDERWVEPEDPDSNERLVREKILDSLGGLTRSEGAGTLEEAVDVAHQAAIPGDIVLLSPGCSSFDMFKDYAERGEAFCEAVRGLTKGD